MPTIFVLAAHECMFMQEELTAARVTTNDGRVVERCEAVAVLVIRRGAKLQKGLGQKFKVVTDFKRPLAWNEVQMPGARSPTGHSEPD